MSSFGCFSVTDATHVRGQCVVVVVTVDELVAEVATVDVFVAELTHGTASKGP